MTSSGTAVVKDVLDFAWAHTTFTTRPVGVVDLRAKAITEWALSLVIVESHSSVDLHPEDGYLFEAACDEVCATGSILATTLRARPAGIGACWYICETRLIPVHVPTIDGLHWGVLEITTPCTSSVEPIVKAGTRKPLKG